MYKRQVYDLGGGTFDVTILQMGDGVFEVMSTSGDSHLGGDDFDQRIVKWMVDDFKKDQGIDLSNDKMALQRLRESAEKAKIELSTVMQTEINLPFITADASGPKHLVMTLTRANLEKLVTDLVDKTLNPCKKSMKDAGITSKKLDAVVLVGGMTRMPFVQSAVVKLFGKEPHQGVNPDEVVAIGAAIQAGILSKDIEEDLVLLDVTPLTLGIETLGGVSTPLIPRNTTIPTDKSEVFTTAADNQPSVEVHVLQGERSMATENKTIGRFMLDGILAAPRGTPQVEVTFDIDKDGILSVSAKDKGTGKEQSITITANSGLSDEEIEKMVQDAEANADADELKRESVQLKNNSEQVIYQAEKMLQDNKDKIQEDIKVEVESKIAEVKTALENEDETAIKQAMEELQASMQKVGSSVYSDDQSANNSEPDNDIPNDTVEGEYKEKEE